MTQAPDAPVRVICDRPVTLVGGGPVRAELLARALRLAPEAVAADGGGDVTLPHGRRFRAVIGDMDSLRHADRLRAGGTILHPITEQDSTDLEKCLYSVTAPLCLGVGFLGGRLDHTLAALNVLVRYAHRPVLLAGGVDLCFVCPPGWTYDAPRGMRVSLFPLGKVKGGACTGLRWPVGGLELAPDARIGTSNEALGGPIRLDFDAPCVVVILPVETLETVVGSLGVGSLGTDRPPHHP